MQERKRVVFESLQEEFAPCRGRFAAGVVTTEGKVESLSPSFYFGVLRNRRGRMEEAERQVEGLFESMLSESIG